MPVEEPSTASIADIGAAADASSHATDAMIDISRAEAGIEGLRPQKLAAAVAC